MARELFVDSSGWYALLDRRDPHHARARRVAAQTAKAHAMLVTTDYVIDETATLTKSRAGPHACTRFFDLIEQTRALRIEWIGPERFDSARRFFRKYLDHGYSFTDSTSFEIMRELGIGDALTSDAHFVEAGFGALLDRT